MNTFEMLSPFIQKRIWDMGWKNFTPVQDEAIYTIMLKKGDVVISAGTASGKTEAAFLPILSLIEVESRDKLKVIYISPLKALINNQFSRIIELCESTDIKINKWHGDVGQSQKKKFIKNPKGILQITPESIESLFINRTEHLHRIFSDVEFIILDEIHTFISSDRGVHLRSLISRMEKYTKKRPRIIGLSATISNFDKIKFWVNSEDTQNVDIIESQGFDKKLLYSLMYFESTGKIAMELIHDLREITRNHKAIIFCNSRGEVEDITYNLNKFSVKEEIGESYFAHHSSVDKKEREYVEKQMIDTKVPKSVIATSSLELGIDIGDVDIVVQIDNTFTVSSLKQRYGRSGRKKGTNQILQLYATNENTLLQSLAVMELNLDGWIEPAEYYKIPYDIAFQQIISICAETNGVSKSDIIRKLFNASVFQTLEPQKVEELIYYMTEMDVLEYIPGSDEYIVGISGEHILRSKDFYAVFQTNEEFLVVNGAHKIGSLDKSSMINLEDNIILAGKLWTIKEIDNEKNKIYVNVAVNGKPPKYTGGNIKFHPKIGEKIIEIICNNHTFHYISEEGQNTLQDLRRKYHYIELKESERPIWILKDSILFETFTGSVIAKTIYWMLKSVELNVKYVDGLGRIEISKDSSFNEKFEILMHKEWNIKDLLKVTNENELFKSKYSAYLPKELILEMHIQHKVDIEGAITFLKKYKFRII